MATSPQNITALIPQEVRQFESQIVEMAKAHDLDVGQMARLVYPERNKLTLKKDGVLTLAVRHPEYGGHKVELLGEIGRGTKGDGSDKLLVGDFRAVVTLWRKGTEREDRSVFVWSLMDAWTAGLLSKANYKKYPKDMCLARCIVRAVKAVLPDALLGLNTEAEVEHLDDDERPPKPTPTPKPNRSRNRHRNRNRSRSRSRGGNRSRSDRLLPLTPIMGFSPN